MTKNTFKPTSAQLARVQRIINDLRKQPAAVSCTARLELAGPLEHVTIRRDGTWCIHGPQGDTEMGAKSPVRVTRNQWDNWLCYMGPVRVEMYGSLHDARVWLARQIKAGHPLSNASLLRPDEIEHLMELVE